MKNEKLSIALFKGKLYNKHHRYQGAVTPEGRRFLEEQRKRIGALVGKKRISDGDLFEWLARGDDNAKAALGLT